MAPIETIVNYFRIYPTCTKRNVLSQIRINRGTNKFCYSLIPIKETINHGLLFFGLLKSAYWTSKPVLRLGEQCEMDGLLNQRNRISPEKVVLSKLSLI